LGLAESWVFGKGAVRESRNYLLMSIIQKEDREAKEFLKADCGSRNSENRDEQ
jgi:hypothetical protein